MTEWVSINGQLMPADQARISAFDAGFLQGIGLFETMRVYSGRVFRLERHLDRLCNSARALGWTVVPDAEALHDDVEQVLRAVGPIDGRVRLTVTTGSLRADAADTPQLTTVISVSGAASYPPELYQKGVTILVSRWRQSAAEPTAGHKTTSYFGRLASLREAHAAGAFEALWLTPDEHVAEGAISTVFAVIDEQLVTPPQDTPVLPGIARATIIECAVDLGVPVQERPLSVPDLLAAEELFLSNSMMEVMPVVRIGRERIGNEKVGETTRLLAVAYTNQVRDECDRD